MLRSKRVCLVPARSRLFPAPNQAVRMPIVKQRECQNPRCVIPFVFSRSFARTNGVSKLSSSISIFMQTRPEHAVAAGVDLLGDSLPRSERANALPLPRMPRFIGFARKGRAVTTTRLSVLRAKYIGRLDSRKNALTFGTNIACVHSRELGECKAFQRSPVVSLTFAPVRTPERRASTLELPSEPMRKSQSAYCRQHRCCQSLPPPSR